MNQRTNLSELIYNIIPGIGINDIVFGMTQRQVIEVLGEPDKEINPNEEGDIVYIYNSIGDFHFDSDEDFRLSSMEIEVNPELMISGINIFNKNRNEILELFEEENAEIKELENEEGPFETSIDFPALCLTVYLDENGRTDTISFGVMFNENDEIIWPRKEQFDLFRFV